MIEFLVKLKDMASGPMQKFAATGQNSFNKIGESMAKVSGRFNTLGMNISQIDAKLSQLQKTRAISFDTSQIRRINSEIDQLQNKKNRLEGSTVGGLGSIFRTGLALAGIGSLAYLGKDIMQAGIQRQMDLTALTTLVGKTAGGDLNNKLIDFSIKSPYGGEVMNEGKLLAGSGVGAGKIPHLIQMMGDIALADKERMKSLALGFAEANTRGNLNGQVERMFIQGGLFNPIEQLHKMSGKSNDALKKDMQKGKISIDMLTKAMEYATGPMGRWHNAMKNAMDTPAGKWTAFVGTVSVLAGNIGTKLLPALGHLTDFLNWIVAHGSEIGAAIGAMTIAWTGYTIVTKWAAISTALLEAAAYWPLLVIGGVAAAIAYLVGKNTEYGNSATNTANDVDTAWNKMFHATVIASDKIKGAVTVQTSWLETFLYGINDIWLRIEDVFEKIGNAAASSADKGKKGFAGWWSAVRNFGGALTGDTDASKKRHALEIQRDWHMAMLSRGLQDDGKTPLGAGVPGAPGAGGTGGGAGGGTLGGDTTDKITGGGVRNITINVMKPFTDKVEIHSVNLKEGVQEIEEIFRDMFLRITNSAATAMS